MKYYPVVGLTPQERHNLIGNLVLRFEFDKTKDFDFDEATELLWVAVKAPFKVIDDTLWYDSNISLVNENLFLTSQEQKPVCIIAEKNRIDSFVDFDALKACAQMHAVLFYREVRVQINNHFIPELRNKMSNLLILLNLSDWTQYSLNTLEEKLTRELEKQYAKQGNGTDKKIGILNECLLILRGMNQLKSIYNANTNRENREAYFSALSTLSLSSGTLDMLKQKLSPITKAYYDRDADAMLTHFVQQEKAIAAEAVSCIGSSPNTVMFSPSVSPVIITDKKAIITDDNEDVITLPSYYMPTRSRFSSDT